jgi:hypothetical protein
MFKNNNLICFNLLLKFKFIIIILLLLFIFFSHEDLNNLFPIPYKVPPVTKPIQNKIISFLKPFIYFFPLLFYYFLIMKSC